MSQTPADPALSIARYLPRGAFGPQSRRWLIPLYRALLRLQRPKVPQVDLPNGQRMFLFRPARPVAGPQPGLLWIHGGGLLFGTPLIDADLCAGLAERLGLVVAAPSYRLAPEHPYPAAHDDVRAAHAALVAMMDLDPARIAIGGDSAGGGLAAALTAGLCAQGRAPAFLLLHEPMLDEATRKVRQTPPGSRLWSDGNNRYAWDAYLRDVAGGVPPTASAPRADDALLARFPPTWIGVGTADLFHAEALAFAARLAALDVPVSLREVQGAFHGFHKVIPHAALTRDYMVELERALALGLRLDA